MIVVLPYFEAALPYTWRFLGGYSSRSFSTNVILLPQYVFLNFAAKPYEFHSRSTIEFVLLLNCRRVTNCKKVCANFWWQEIFQVHLTCATRPNTSSDRWYSIDYILLSMKRKMYFFRNFYKRIKPGKIFSKLFYL